MLSDDPPPDESEGNDYRKRVIYFNPIADYSVAEGVYQELLNLGAIDRGHICNRYMVDLYSLGIEATIVFGTSLVKKPGGGIDWEMGVEYAGREDVGDKIKDIILPLKEKINRYAAGVLNTDI